MDYSWNADAAPTLAEALLHESMNTERGPLVGSPYHQEPDVDVNPGLDPESVENMAFHTAASEMMGHMKNQDHAGFAQSLRNFIRMQKDYD